MTIKPINLTKLLLPYENKWVALSEDKKEVLGSGNSLKEAEREAEKKSKSFIFLKVPSFNISYVPVST